MKIIHITDKQAALKALDLLTMSNFKQHTYSAKQIEAAKLELKSLPVYGIGNVVRRAELLEIINNPRKDEPELSRDQIEELQYLHELFSFRNY